MENNKKKWWVWVSVYLCISLILFIIGFKWTLDIKLLPIKRTTLISFVAIVWFSLFLGFFSNYVNYLGGAFGYHFNTWLKFTVGSFGTFIFLIILLYILLVALFNPDFKAIFNNLMNRFGARDQEEDDFES